MSRPPNHPCFKECQRLAARGLPCGEVCDYQDWEPPQDSPLESTVKALAVDIETELCAEVAANTEKDFPEVADEPRTGAHVGDYWNGYRAACEEIACRIRLRNVEKPDAQLAAGGGEVKS